MKRREFLAGSAKAAAGMALQTAGLTAKLPKWMRRKPAPKQAEVPPHRGVNSLREHAEARGLLVGCVVDAGTLSTDQAYASLVREQANLVVAENAMQWDHLQPTMDRYDFEAADTLIAFAEANRMRVRGHTLCWHRQLPEWFQAHANEKNARELLTTHIEHVAGRYAGRMHSWDVVNEAILVEDGRPDGLRDSPWLRLVGEGYLEAAFHAARAADPQALLTLNEFGIEGQDNAAERKRVAMIALLRRMKARNVPVDAVGIESHLRVGEPYGEGLKGFLAQMRELGLQVMITEMDVDDTSSEKTKVAAMYGRYLDLMLSDGNVTAVVMRSLPFDGEGKPTEAYLAIRDAVDGRWHALSVAKRDWA